MNTLAEYTSPRLIIPQLRSRDAAAVTAELCSTLDRDGRVKELLAFYNAVLSHECLSSTAMAPGLAIPHARIPGLSQVSFALGRCPEPMPWFGQQPQPVQLVFLFAVPDRETGAYLAMLSALAKLTRDAGRWNRLINAADGGEMFAVLSEIYLPRSQAPNRKLLTEAARTF